MTETDDAETDVEDPVEESEDAQELFDAVKDREAAFEKGWWKHADAAVELYNCEKEDPKNPYNILYANTEVLKPSLYSATPKPDVRQRFIEQPPSPVTQLVENFLIVFSDPANPGEESFDTAMDQTVLSSLTSGMGFVRIRHYPEKPLPICVESGHYKGLIWAPGRKWSKLPWIAFRHEMTKDEIFSQFEISDEDKKKYQVEEDSESPEDDEKSIVYEVWEKEEREIYYFCEDWEGNLIKKEPDRMQLQGFYPTPGLLLMTHKPGRLIPTPLYQYYRNQAEELNRVTARLNKVLSAIKVRGAYNALLGTELAGLLNDGDGDMENKLIPAQEAGMLAQNGGFERQIWMLPIEKLVEVASQLYNARIQIKQVIYEITGLSDIIRGSNVASETATATNMKNKWGSIRLRDMQKFVASYVRDIYRLSVDAAVQLVPAEQWKAITGIQLPLQAEKMVAQQQAAYSQAMQRPVDPKLEAALSAPTIEDLLLKISSDQNRAFAINVQSDSTIDLDTATDKQEVTEFMNAMGQLMAGLQPLAALGPSGLEAAKSVLIGMCQRFKFGLQIVDSLKAIQPPPPAANPQMQEQEKQLQDLLTQVEDAKRDLETKQKEFAADVKVFKAEKQAAEKVMAADAKAKSAEETAAFVQRKSELTTATAGMKATQKVAQKTNDTIAPVMGAVAEAISELQKAVAAISSPGQVTKQPDGSWLVQ